MNIRDLGVRFNAIKIWKAWAVCLGMVGLAVLWKHFFPILVAYQDFFSSDISVWLVFVFMIPFIVAVIRTEQEALVWLKRHPYTETATVALVAVLGGYFVFSDPFVWNSIKWALYPVLLYFGLFFIFVFVVSVYRYHHFTKKN